MPRVENTPVVLVRLLLSLVVAPLLSSCSTLIDEIRIRVDPNTIVKPDVDELRELELASGTYDVEGTAPAAYGERTTLVEGLYRATPPGVISRRKERPSRGSSRVPRAFGGGAQQQPAYPEPDGAGTLLPEARGYGQDYRAAVPQAPSPAPPPVAGPPQPGAGAPAYDRSVIEELR